MSDSSYARLGALARMQGGEVEPRVDAAGRSALVAAVAGRASSRKLPRRVVWGALAAAAIALLFVVALWPDAAQPLTYRVTGAAVESDYVRAEAGATVAFSDGSVAELSAGAALRIVELDAHGARVALEGGRAAFAVHHASDTSWRVEVGPFSVHVTGTRFSVTWSGEAQALEVEVEQGEVVVRGPLAPDGIGVHASQRLAAALRTGELRVTDDEVARGQRSAEPVLAGPSMPHVEGGAQPSASASVEAPLVTSAATVASSAPPSWAQLVARGEFAAVLAEATAGGVEGAVHGRPIGDVLALADAARYQGRSDVARTALLAVRERAPGSEAAAGAAFLLGTMAEGGSPRAALGWYDRYLAEAPRGPFAAEALGRKMVAVYRSQGKDAARPLAEQYRRHYPRGPHASTAEQILRP